MKIIPLGAAREVGRSCIIIEYVNVRIMLDCGIHPTQKEILPKFEKVFFSHTKENKIYLDFSSLDMIIVSHFHLDHCGAIPFLFYQNRIQDSKYIVFKPFSGKIITTSPTASIMALQLSDFIKFSHLYTELEISTMKIHIENIDHNVTQKYNFDDVEIKLSAFNAGHVIGAAMFHLFFNQLDSASAGMSILYTGDFMTSGEIHLPDACFDLSKILLKYSQFRKRRKKDKIDNELENNTVNYNNDYLEKNNKSYKIIANEKKVDKISNDYEIQNMERSDRSQMEKNNSLVEIFTDQIDEIEKNEIQYNEIKQPDIEKQEETYQSEFTNVDDSINNQKIDYQLNIKMKNSNKAINNAVNENNDSIFTFESKTINLSNLSHKNTTKKSFKDIFREIQRPDILITESTYGTINRVNRIEKIYKLVNEMIPILKANKKILIPCFALGRIYEIFSMLEKYLPYDLFQKTIFLCASNVMETGIQLYRRYGDYLNSEFDFQGIAYRLEDKVKPFKNDYLSYDGSIIIFSSPGTLTKGLTQKIFSSICTDSGNLVILPGKCCTEVDIETSPIEDEKMGDFQYFITDKGMKIKVKCKIKTIGFSAHADSNSIIRSIKTINPKNVILVHGQKNRIIKFKKILNKELNCHFLDTFKAYPEFHDSIEDIKNIFKSDSIKVHDPCIGESLNFKECDFFLMKSKQKLKYSKNNNNRILMKYKKEENVFFTDNLGEYYRKSE